jgi:hypothetical protein
MLASRKITQFPSGFLRSTDSAGPLRWVAAPPLIGCNVTFSSFQQYAQSPKTRISWMSGGPAR